MKKFEAKVIDPIGFHARPTTKLVQSARPFTSKITITSNGKTSDIKNPLGIMSMAIKHGATITIEANGADEVNAIAAISKVLKTEKLV